MLSCHGSFGSSQGRHTVPSLTLGRDDRVMLSRSLLMLPVHICLLAHPVHWTPTGNTGVLFIGKAAQYRAEQIMRVQFFLICSCAVALPLCKQGG